MFLVEEIWAIQKYEKREKYLWTHEGPSIEKNVSI